MSADRYSAIEHKIAELIEMDGYKSKSIGRIRDVIAVSQMPSIDIAVLGHEVQDDGCNPTYVADLQILICAHGYQRTARNIEIHEMVLRVCDQIEFKSGLPAYDVIRDIDVQMQNDGEAADSGSSVRKAIITAKIYY